MDGSSQGSASVSLMKGESRWSNHENEAPVLSSAAVENPGSSQSITSSTGNSISTFSERQFRLPARDVTKELFTREDKKQSKAFAREITKRNEMFSREQQLLTSLDRMKRAPPAQSVSSCEVLQSTRILKESLAELNVVKHIITRKPGENFGSGNAFRSAEGDDAEEDVDNDESTISSEGGKIEKKLAADIQEKVEDLLQEDIEIWLRRHGKRIAMKDTNEQRRLLRKWFKDLDADGGGSVSVDELQDPLLSTGIMKTREQVIRVISNVDQDGNMAIEFPEFVTALNENTIADPVRIAKLQAMSCNTIFSMDTLITAERRKQLFRSIVRACDKRQKEVDVIMRRVDRPVAKMTKAELAQMTTDVESLDDKQQKSVRLHAQYIAALHRVLEDKKDYYMAKEAAENAKKERHRNEIMQQLQDHTAYRRGAASSYFSSPNQNTLARAAGKQKGSQKSPDSHRPQEYDFRRDINVLSHPRYSKAVRKIVMESPHEDHNSIASVKMNRSVVSGSESHSSEKYKIFRAKGL